jgi:hypothetical protein
VKSTDRDISYSHVRIVASPYIELDCFFHIYYMNDFRCVRTYTLKDYVVIFAVRAFRWCVVLNDIKPLLSVQTPSLIRIRLLAQFTL